MTLSLELEDLVTQAAQTLDQPKAALVKVLAPLLSYFQPTLEDGVTVLTPKIEQTQYFVVAFDITRYHQEGKEEITGYEHFYFALSVQGPRPGDDVKDPNERYDKLKAIECLQAWCGIEPSDDTCPYTETTIVGGSTFVPREMVPAHWLEPVGEWAAAWHIGKQVYWIDDIVVSVTRGLRYKQGVQTDVPHNLM